jgi:nucleotide-binding universal stress UspA family protein
MSELNQITGEKKPLAIWTLNPFEKKFGRNKSVLNEINLLNNSYHPKILPVSVISSEGLNWPVEVKSSWLERLHEVTANSVDKILRDSKVNGLLSTEVLIEASTSVYDPVKAVVTFAEEQGAEVIVAGTHAYSGLQHLLLGSFTETLMQISTVPVLTVNPSARIKKKVSRILYPTDFTRSSNKQFGDVIQWAKKFGAHIVLFNRIEDPIFSPYGGYYPMPVVDFVDDIIKSRQKRAKAMIHQAEAEGISCELVMKRNMIDLGTSILREEKNSRIDLIIIGLAKAGRQRHVGKTSKKIVRVAKSPVMILPP